MSVAKVTPDWLFVVGMPRSGTKLLRTILHNHPRVGIATNETEFLPNWISEWKSYGDLAEKQNFERFYQRCLRFPYFLNKKRKDTLISCQSWWSNCSTFDLPGVFGALVQHDIGEKPNLRWLGDKSPGYTLRIRELNTVFPNAVFVHVCRDARDYAMSVQKAWGKNLIRAVQDWKEGLAYVRKVQESTGVKLFTVKYESLLENPETTIQGVCEFLGLDYQPSMLHFERAVENVGDARGQTRIVRGNMQKYIDGIPPRTLKQMELICGRELTNWGYDVRGEAGDQNLSPFVRTAIHVGDAAKVLQSTIKRRGLLYGLKYSLLFRLMKFTRKPEDQA